MDFFIRLNAFFGGFGFGLGTEAADDTRWYQFGAIGKNTIRFSERISFCEYVDKRLSYFIPLCKYFLQPKSVATTPTPAEMLLYSLVFMGLFTFFLAYFGNKLLAQSFFQ